MQDSQLPLFDEVKAEHVVPGITKLIEDMNAELDELERTVQPTWSSLVEPLERLTDKSSRAWGTVSHLKVLHLYADTFLLFDKAFKLLEGAIETLHVSRRRICRCWQLEHPDPMHAMPDRSDFTLTIFLCKAGTENCLQQLPIPCKM